MSALRSVPNRKGRGGARTINRQWASPSELQQFPVCVWSSVAQKRSTLSRRLHHREVQLQKTKSDVRSRSERLPVIPYPRACLPPASCSPLDRQRLPPAAPSTSASPLLSNPAVVPRPFRFTGPCLSLRMPQRSHQRGSLS